MLKTVRNTTVFVRLHHMEEIYAFTHQKPIFKSP
jgi:hypothetical protein